MDMDSFLALCGVGLWKEQQQIALKLHNAFPGESRYLYWALLSMVFQSPNRCGHHTEPPNPILVSIAHRCLQTLLKQDLRLQDSSSESLSQPPLEDSNNFWMILKVLEMVGQWFPEEDHSKIVGIGKLKYPESLFKPSSSSSQAISAPESKDSKISSVHQAHLLSGVASLSLNSNPRPICLIESRRSELPEYISLVREDYFKIFDSELGQEMRKNYLHLELVWRQRAVEWANSAGLKELIHRMKEQLCLGDRNWSTMITLNQSVANLFQIDESALNEIKILDDFYTGLNANQAAQKETERGYTLAQVDLRCRLQDPSFSKLKRNLPPLAENLDEVIHSYFVQFGQKTCCFDDLVPYLKSLTSDQANKLGSKLKQNSITSAHQDSSFSESFLCRQINLEKIFRSVTLGDQHVTEATKLLQCYFQHLPLGHELPATALQPADGLAILAAQALIQDWQGPDGSVANLYSATYILETCLSRSTHQYQVRSLLIRLHRLLGNCPQSLLHFSKYGIKHIQHDTLSHLALDRCSIFFSHTLPSKDSQDTKNRALNVQNLIEYPASIYEYVEGDTVTWISHCYLDERYIQVEDLHYFMHQITSSLQRKIVRMERLRLKLFEKTSFLLDNHKKDDITRPKHPTIPPQSVWDINEVEMTIIEVLGNCELTIDNRDFTVIPDCQPWSSSGTCHQTSLGPPLGNRWVWVVGSTYARIIAPHLKLPDHSSLSQPDFFSECSLYEVDLFEYSKTLASLVFSPERHRLESHAQHLVDFFQRRNDEFETAIKASIDGQHSTHQIPPSQLLAIIHNVYEGFCLFDFVFRQFGPLSSSSITKNSTLIIKTLTSIKTKILKKFKKLDLLIQELLGVIASNAQLLEKNSHTNGSIHQIKCLFASSLGDKFLWQGDAIDKDFGNEANWINFLLTIDSDQRQTLDQWHSLIKLITKNYQ